MKIFLIIPNELLISSDVFVPRRHNYNAKITIGLSETPQAVELVLIKGEKPEFLTVK